MSSDLPADGDDTALDVVVPPLLDGVRVDRALSMLTGCTRSVSGALVADGAVHVDGAAVRKPSQLLSAGQRLQATLGADEEVVLAPEPDVEVPVVLEDPSFLVVDKPAGLVVHPGAGHLAGTLVAGLLARYPELAALGELPGAAPHRPGIVQRLDKGTSGLLVVARTPAAYASLSAQLAARTVERRYAGLVEGDVADDRGVIDAPIGRSQRTPTKMAVRTGGRPARTAYEVRARFATPARTLLELRLEIGPHPPDPRAPGGHRPADRERPALRPAPRRGARRGPRLPARRRPRLRAPRDRRDGPRHLDAARRPPVASRRASAAERRSVHGVDRREPLDALASQPCRARRGASEGEHARDGEARVGRTEQGEDLVVAPPGHRGQHAAEPGVVRREEDRPGERVDRGPADEAVALLVAVDRRQRAQVREEDERARAPRRASLRTRGPRRAPPRRPCGAARSAASSAARSVSGANGTSPALAMARYSYQPVRYRSRSARRLPPSSTTTTRQPWRLPPLGAKRAVSSRS